MKIFLLLTLLLFTPVTLPAAGLTLEQGEVWTYQFHDLPFALSGLNPGASVARFSLAFLSNSVAPGTSLRWEAFESGTNSLRASGVISEPGPSATLLVAVASATWADLEGAIRLTMLTGSVVVSSVGFDVQLQRGGGTMDFYRNSFVPLDVPVPLIATQFVSNVGFQTASVDVSVDARNLPTSVNLQWGSTTNYGQGTTPFLIDRDYPVSRQFILSNLSAASGYHVRTVASNSAGVVYGSDLGFSTLFPCTVVAELPFRAANSAVLRATVAANGFNTSVYFEWGTTTNYGSLTPVQSVGNPIAPTNVSTQIAGLIPGTVYHYRAVAFALGITNRSQDIAFTTTLAPVNVVVTNLANQSVPELLAQGGNVRFECDGVVTLSEPIVVGNDVAVDATGYSIRLSGNDVTRLFTVLPGVVLSLTNLTLSNGRQSVGGAILNEQGIVNAFRCRFIDNVAAGAAGTNGVDGTNGTASSVSLEYVTAGGHASDGSSGEDGWGGAIFNSGILRIKECSLENNFVIGGTGGTGGSGGRGGVLFGFGGMPQAGRSGGNGGAPGDGGAARGAAIANVGLLSADGCSFSNSLATGGRGGTGGMGGTRGHQSNSGTNGLARAGGLGGLGAGTAVFTSGQSSISNCVFLLNSSVGGMGGTGAALGPSIGSFPREGGRGGNAMGGAFFFSSNSFLVNCTFVSNSVSGGRGGDGGVFIGGYQSSGSGGDSFGGGVFIEGAGAMVNLTISHNTATGGLTSTNPVHSNFPVVGFKGGGFGGSIAATSSVQIANSILSSGSSNNCYGVMMDGGHNLSSDMTPAWSSGTSLNNVDPLLLPLADNGGPTMTMALQTNSPALNSADPSLSPAADQRGYPRPRGPGHDIGAYEGGVPPLEIASILASSYQLRWLAERDCVYRIEETLDFTTWSVMGTNVGPSNGWRGWLVPSNSTRRFFRLIQQ